LAAYERNIASDARLAAQDAARQSQQQQQQQRQQKQQQQQKQQKQPQQQKQQQKQKQPPKAPVTTSPSDEDFHSGILKRIDETADRLRQILDDDEFDDALGKALNDYEAVVTTRDLDLPTMTEVAAEWQDARIAFLTQISEAYAREDTAARGDTSFTSETMEDAGHETDDASSDFSDDPPTLLLPEQTPVPILHIPVPPSPPSLTGLGTAERGVISPPPGPVTRSATRRNV
jgi:signal recognition particle GTPase